MYGEYHCLVWTHLIKVWMIKQTAKLICGFWLVCISFGIDVIHVVHNWTTPWWEVHMFSKNKVCVRANEICGLDWHRRVFSAWVRQCDEQLGYVVLLVMYYHFRIPKENLDFGLRAFGNDDDVCMLSKYIRSNKVIKVYTDHGNINLLTYFMSVVTRPKLWLRTWMMVMM